MNPELLSHDLSAWLADVALQSTVLLAVAGGVVLLSPRMAAARRHSLTAAALLTIPVLMLSSGLAPVWRPFDAAIPSSRLTLPPAPILRKTIHADGSQTAVLVRDPFQAGPPQASSRWHLWAWVWIGGVGLGLVALLKAAHDLRRLKRGSKVECDARLRQLFQEAKQALMVTLPDTALRRSPHCAVPMTWGLRESTVLLPENADTWPDARLRLVFHHELAHITRGDVPVSLLTTLSTLLLWFHPLAWWLRRECDQAREQACDDIALEHAASGREDFADELLAAVSELGGFRRRILPLALAMAASPGAAVVKRRLASLLDETRARHPWPELQGRLLYVSMAVVAFALSGLAACRGTSQARGPQVQITSKVIEITTREGDDAGLEDTGLLAADGQGLKLIGIHDDHALHEILRKLNQRKGVDLMSAPSVTTRDGQRAQVEVAREFIYPTEFDPPKLPEFKDGKPIRLLPGQSIAVTPTTPTAFEMKPVGVRMEFIPRIADAESMDLEIGAEVTEFEGFHDYGSPIKASTVGADGKMQETVLTENRIQQPIFSTRKTSTTIHLRHGSAAVFGGLMRTDTQTVVDGDTTTEDKFKRAVFFIVQARIAPSTDAGEKPK